MLDDILLTIFKFLPQRLLSELFGKFAELKNPPFIAKISIRVFAFLYKVNLAEAKKSLSEFNSLQEFFLRELKLDARPLGGGILSPADGRVRDYGKVHEREIYKIKGKSYSLKKLIGEDLASKFTNGSFINIYLSPSDYHHVHAPFSGLIKETRFIDGKLWPVTNWALRAHEDLYAENARTLTLIENDHGLWCVVMVAAFNVGQIELAYNSKQSAADANNYEIKRGELFGSFKLGSSVLIFAADESFKALNLKENQAVKVGQTLVAQ